MKNFFYFIIIFPIISVCQENLVPNPSFEDYSECPTGKGQINKTLFWNSPSAGSPDYYNSCNLGNVGVPTNQGGFQYAHSGDAYSGIAVFFKYLPNHREYIQVELNTPLEFNKTYLINFFVSLHDSDNYAIKNIGVLFSNEAINESTIENLNYLPQFEYNKYIIDKENWSQINCNYIANGGEKYFIIGNFKPDSLTDTLLVSNFIANSSYYYIDDVSVTLDTTVGANEELNVKSEEYKIYPNPSSSSLYIELFNLNNDYVAFELYDIIGMKVMDNTLEKLINILDISVLPQGIYHYKLQMNKKISSGKIIIIH